ncbi:MAG TPA: IS4 family transposase [Saprospiraceae bacterium]|nr:IS4 family transposase [Saprospiraceae bacterium]HRP84987.1 IS4 family transposase [Saprospiraceae bacterium]
MLKITLFSQVLYHLDRTIFKKIVRDHQTDKYSKGIDSWTHLVSMLFMQFADASSVRDNSNGLRSATGDLNHLGVKKAPSKSSISYINANRSYKIFEEYFYALLDKLEPSLQCRRQYAARLKRKIYIMDGSVIPLCLSLFDWAKFRTTKGGIKLHTVLDYDTGLPCFATITDAKTHEVNEARSIAFPSGSIVVMDRGYVDYKWLFNLDS